MWNKMSTSFSIVDGGEKNSYVKRFERNVYPTGHPPREYVED